MPSNSLLIIVDHCSLILGSLEKMGIGNQKAPSQPKCRAKNRTLSPVPTKDHTFLEKASLTNKISLPWECWGEGYLMYHPSLVSQFLEVKLCFHKHKNLHQFSTTIFLEGFDSSHLGLNTQTTFILWLAYHLTYFFFVLTAWHSNMLGDLHWTSKNRHEIYREIWRGCLNNCYCAFRG